MVSCTKTDRLCPSSNLLIRLSPGVFGVSSWPADNCGTDMLISRVERSSPPRLVLEIVSVSFQWKQFYICCGKLQRNWWSVSNCNHVNVKNVSKMLDIELTGYILMAAKTQFFIKTVKIFTHDDVCEEPSH